MSKRKNPKLDLTNILLDLHKSMVISKMLMDLMAVAPMMTDSDLDESLTIIDEAIKTDVHIKIKKGEQK